MKGGVITAGDLVTAQAGQKILSAGGNAFDASVAAALTSFVSESTLTSTGGGGFCLANTSKGQRILYDFFTQSPVQRNPNSKLDFYKSHINFMDSSQEFMIGMASAAIPGNIAGLFQIHNQLGRMPLDEVVKPAIDVANKGVVVTPYIRYNFHVVNDVLLAEEPSRNIYKPVGKLLDVGDKYYFNDFANMLDILSKEGPREFYEGEYARNIVKDSQERGGHLTMRDFEEYKVIERKPLDFRYRDHEILTNPLPSSGGILIAFMLKLLERVELKDSIFGSPFHLNCLVDSMRLTAKTRSEILDKRQHEDEISQAFLHDAHFIELGEVLKRHSSRFPSTTHLTVEDYEGNISSLTSSFGTGCGYIMPGTDSMLNNMLGEEDLNPHGFHQWPLNQRLTSMMAPTIIFKNQKPVMALGSGGANRIRTAIMQAIVNKVDFGMSHDDVVNKARIHWEENVVSYEPGFSQESIDQIDDIDNFEKVLFTSNNMFFGGVQAIIANEKGELVGAGDRRREGVVLKC